MERVEELMTKRKWVKHCLRTNCAAPEDCVMTGKIKVAKIYSNLLCQREKEPELYDAILTINTMNDLCFRPYAVLQLNLC